MYKKKEHIHFVGIGGIGMSGIALMLVQQGYIISGCDTSYSSLLKTLHEQGCHINEGHDELHASKADIIVYSSAINSHHPELIAAQNRGIPTIPRAVMLAEIMRTKFSVAVAGSHGKTTTTSLISHIMIEAQQHPTVIIGGRLKNIDSNALMGKSDILIAEADESDRSLLYLNPTMAIINNIDAEHLDVYKDIDDVKATFQNFLERLPFYGKAFLGIDDQHIHQLLKLKHIPIITFGFDQNAHIKAEVIELAGGYSKFKVLARNHNDQPHALLGEVALPFPGKHNILNALAAIALCLEFDIPFETIAHALNSFEGVARRFEYKGTFKGSEIFDDYAHHPTEIYHTLCAAQRRKRKKLHVIFQPHRYSRTAKLWDEFVHVFANQEAPYKIDHLYIADIYPASEEPIDGINSKAFVAALRTHNKSLLSQHSGSYNSTEQLVKQNISEGDFVITIGAGKINNVGLALVAKK